jgi:hypothetical protein
MVDILSMERPMNRVPLARRIQIINCLVEGNSIRSTERMTGTHRDTICRLLVDVGDGCAKLMDQQMRELPCRRIEVDEIWAYVGKKQRHMTPLDDPRRVGDQYTFVALDPETKIVPAYRVRFASRSERSVMNAVAVGRSRLPGAAFIGCAGGLCRSDRASVRRRCRLRPSG